ncbi:MAG: hypothetical protein JWQ49_5241 [Edaphobacter sp.]|nr:hypothetical protein [Edaphobacter sp.]
MDSSECISAELTFRKSVLVSHFGEDNVRFASLILECLYVAFFIALGIAVVRLMQLRR